MYTNRSRWTFLRAVRRKTRIIRPNDPVLKGLPKLVQQMLHYQFKSMERVSSVGRYRPEHDAVYLLDGTRSTRRHEVMHAVTGYVRDNPQFGRLFSLPVRLVGWMYKSKPAWLRTLGFIMDETVAAWVDGDRTFFFRCPSTYTAMAARTSAPAAVSWLAITASIRILPWFCAGIACSECVKWIYRICK